METLAPPWILTAPSAILVAFVEFVNVVIPPTPSVLFNCVAPATVTVEPILAAPATLIPPFGTTTAPMPCAVVAILALAHRLLFAANTVNVPVDAVALPIGVELIAANCASPPITLPSNCAVKPWTTAPVLPIITAEILPTATVEAVKKLAPTVLANTLPVVLICPAFSCAVEILPLVLI